MRAFLAFAAAPLAAVALPAAPASAEDSPRSVFVSGGGSFFDGSGFHFGLGHDDRDDRRDRRDRRRLRGTDTVIVYDRDYQGDSAWRAESFNDWWHERPNRSHPAWLMRNGDCQRKWWDGSVLRC